ncbi:uncharacterized protein B0T15DRAFT_212655 [Chaetomium strumarium]|uniref:N-acetyltransferase ESCO zinc-finger domain-containing protein n=1 Tax=Chaetomium strumarium TaxID=1170767 RepID=A0AAJ0GTH9_9PEZI|nr:hypothetical protein B0T15DRAFT_212655 [Chaetomium strumarium]
MNSTDPGIMSINQPTIPAADVPPVTITPERRKRPLRTYSRRSAPAKGHYGESAPQSEEEKTETVPDVPRAESPQLPVLPRQDQTKRPSRGSILAYFKPVPPSSDDAPVAFACSDSAEPLSTPPTSPLALLLPRKRRRLTTRPHLNPDQRVTDGAEGCIKTDSEPDEESRTSKSRSSSIESTIVVGGNSDSALRPPLCSVAVNTLQPQAAPVSALEHAKPKTTRTSEKKKPAKDMTQTTLSLSIHKEPGFTICGACDILYNPLNEKDRREHNRRHAAHSRRKTKLSS